MFLNRHGYSYSGFQNFVPFRIGVGVAIGIGIETVSSDPDITEADSAINESHFQDVTYRNIFMTTAIEGLSDQRSKRFQGSGVRLKP